MIRSQISCGFLNGNAYIYKKQNNLMKKFIPLLILLLSLNSFYAQQFESDIDVITYMDGKKFYDSENAMQIEYGYISDLNTYGIRVTNKLNAVFYFINVSIESYGNSADMYGMSPTSGNNFGFRLFAKKLIVGYGEEESHTFYMQ